MNGVYVRGKSAFEVSSMLQGPNETSVTIKVKIHNFSMLWNIAFVIVFLS